MYFFAEKGKPNFVTFQNKQLSLSEDNMYPKNRCIHIYDLSIYLSTDLPKCGGQYPSSWLLTGPTPVRAARTRLGRVPGCGPVEAAVWCLLSDRSCPAWDTSSVVWTFYLGLY